MRLLSILSVAAIVVFTACNSVKPVTGTSSSDVLKGKTWVLTQINNAALTKSPAREIVLNFNNLNTISGNGGCNTYGGQYLVSGNNELKFSSVYSTKMACESLDLENIYFESINNTRSFEVTGNTLRLLNGTQELLEFAGKSK